MTADILRLSSVLRPDMPTCGHVYDEADAPMVCILPVHHAGDHGDDRTCWPRESTAAELRAELDAAGRTIAGLRAELAEARRHAARMADDLLRSEIARRRAEAAR